MTTLNMNGPFDLDEVSIDSEVTETSAGNYALGKQSEKGGLVVSYVGRSDSDVNLRLRYWASNSKHAMFKFSYASSPKEAYEKECKNYHDFNPSDNDIHPDKPDDSNLTCPVCGE